MLLFTNLNMIQTRIDYRGGSIDQCKRPYTISATQVIIQNDPDFILMQDHERDPDKWFENVSLQSPALNNANQNHDNRNYQQYMDKPTHSGGRNKSKQPHDDQNDSNSF